MNKTNFLLGIFILVFSGSLFYFYFSNFKGWIILYVMGLLGCVILTAGAIYFIIKSFKKEKESEILSYSRERVS